MSRTTYLETLWQRKCKIRLPKAERNQYAFRYLNDEVENKQLILKATRPNYHFNGPEYLELLRTGIFFTHLKNWKRRTKVERLEIDKSYHHLFLFENLRLFFGSLPIYIEEDGQQQWSHLVSVSVDCLFQLHYCKLYTVTVSFWGVLGSRSYIERGELGDWPAVSLRQIHRRSILPSNRKEPSDENIQQCLGSFHRVELLLKPSKGKNRTRIESL